jgi:hypothetical protein
MLIKFIILIYFQIIYIYIYITHLENFLSDTRKDCLSPKIELNSTVKLDGFF